MKYQLLFIVSIAILCPTWAFFRIGKRDGCFGRSKCKRWNQNAVDYKRLSKWQDKQRSYEDALKGFSEEIQPTDGIDKIRDKVRTGDEQESFKLKDGSEKWNIDVIDFDDDDAEVLDPDFDTDIELDDEIDNAFKILSDDNTHATVRRKNKGTTEDKESTAQSWKDRVKKLVNHLKKILSLIKSKKGQLFEDEIKEVRPGKQSSSDEIFTGSDHFSQGRSSIPIRSSADQAPNKIVGEASKTEDTSESASKKKLTKEGEVNAAWRLHGTMKVFENLRDESNEHKRKRQ